MARITESVAVVTGGGNGIGEATCHRLAEAGATITTVDVDGDAATATANDVATQTSQETLAIKADVGDEAQVEKMARRVEDRFGRADVLVNNAGVRVQPHPVTDADEASWNRVLGANLKGAAFCAKHLIPHMSEGGAVVNVASNGATIGRSGWSQYDATKGGLISMTKDMACDHAPDGIRVNAVSPGWVITDYHLPDDEREAEEFFDAKTSPHADGPGIMKRAAAPDEVANAIQFLASEEASFITGTNLEVDGGVAAVGKGLEWDSLS